MPHCRRSSRPACQGMIRKSVKRFSEKMMLKQGAKSAMTVERHLIAL
jgi:hypothetical protein